MSECNHKWKKEPFAGSIKCLKCGHVEFDVAGECLSLQERAEAAEAKVKELTATRIEWPGGDPPVSEGTLVAYETRGGGYHCSPQMGSKERWKHVDVNSDIVAYWVLEQGR